ncbi:gustatory and pheromone receptor 32a isoform X1 [Teleopsis dalmanni]|uniref:gustatory and pheromone receptor 32a isoform X1 n=1 Tax=Teleopsis dalmanni TaxID=139649 RepID=UPI0018CD62CA|nr:gustatory and pheromone receptor 32a isoform X1 [Teleopsis dalmanni]
MCQGGWTINMPSNKNKDSPTHQRPNYNTEFLREPAKENSVFKDIRTILFILKATGLLPIYKQLSNYEVGPPNKSHEFYSFFVRGVVHGLTIFNLYNLFKPGGSQLFYSYSETDNINQWIEIILCVITYSATVLICTKNSKSFLKIINEILKVDEEVRRQFHATLSNNCEFSVKFIVGICICQWYIIILKIISATNQLTPTSYILIAFYAIQNGMSSIFIIFAAALLRIVSMRFEYLNLVLNGYTYAQQRKISKYWRRVGENGAAAMETFPDISLFTYRMHNKLLRIYKSINECCSLILVGYMGYAFYTITTTAYNLFVQITTNNISMNVLQWCLAWLCLHISLLAILSKSCGQATREANTTSQILARVYGKSKEYQNIIDKFLTKSIKQDVQFTAYGFFVIDNSTLFKIFSAVTTYLVILIQFKQLEDSKMEDQIAAQT